jgi:MFS family permease
MAGFAGGVLGSLNRIIVPTGYTVGTSLYWLVVIMVVGVYTIRGAVAAGLALVLVPEIIKQLPDNLALLQFVLFGLGVVSLARNPEGAFEYFVNLPSRLRERTRMLSGDASAADHEAALAALEAEPIAVDDPDAPLEVLDSTPEERAARRSRRRELTREAIKLRSRIPAYPISFLYIVTLAFAIDAMARSLLGIVLEDVRRDFGVGDFDMSALNAGYAVVAGISVIPFGIIADRWNRKNLIALGFVPWGLAMMWQSVAGTFFLMFIARLFLGSIEGTNGPATPSLLGDYYPVKRRNRAFGIFATGTSLGTTLGIMFGGAMAASMGWRGSFFTFGVLGLLTGLMLYRRLEEPERGLQDALYRLESEIASIERIEELEADALSRPELADEILEAARVGEGASTESRSGRAQGGLATEAAEDAAQDAAEDRAQPAGGNGGVDYRDLSPWQAVIVLARNKTYALLLAGQIVTDFFIGILGFFAITFFRRYHSLSVAGASGVVSLLSIALIVGTVQAGRIGDRLVARGTPGARVKLTWVARLGVFVAISTAWATPNLALAVPGFLLTGYLLGLTNPLTAAVTVDIVVARLRGQSQGLVAAVRAGATALGPLILGYLSDVYGMRQGTLFLAPTLLVSTAITWLAGRFYDRDHEQAQREAVRQHALEVADPRGGGPVEAVEAGLAST